MAFTYEFYIDGKKEEVEIGFTTSRKWEEALDEATLVIPFAYKNDKPYKMFSMLDIEITEIDNYVDRNVIETRKYEFLIFSDRVESLGSYGYYRHSVNAIEYTFKFDYYMINNLSKSRSMVSNALARFTTNESINKYRVGSGPDAYNINVAMQGLEIKQKLYTNKALSFNQVYEPYIFTGPLLGNYRRGQAVIKTNAPLVSGTSPHILSSGPANWVFPKGKYEIEYGFMGISGDYYLYSEGFNWLYKFYVDVLDPDELSIYDVLNEIRDLVSKYGGIEDTIYYDTTRIFDIDPEYEDYLKGIQAPQIYLENATARQMLIYVLSFVNALPRLIRENSIDKLTLERYNLNNGTFVLEDLIGFGGEQNTNQIGSKNYQPISQSLASNLDDASIHTPSKTSYQQVRSLDIQLTANNFAIKLPESAPLYMPIKLVVYIPNFTVFDNLSNEVLLSINNMELDLTTRWINIDEWRLKLITTDFPNITRTRIWEEKLGLRLNKVDNIYWQTGDTEIKISDSYGSLFSSNLITNVVQEALSEYAMLHMTAPYIDENGVMNTELNLNYDIPGIGEYKDWKFRVEYITDERLVIKQDKEDLSQINFYSEMRQNQEEALVNIVRQSRKGYGDLQRTGNVSHTFPKKHTTLSEFYEVGLRDVNDYTITQIDTEWYNDYAIAHYTITKHHNRIQQGTFVNQRYRPFDNFAKTVLNRHEHYGDYLIAVPPDDTDSGVQEQATKIYSNVKTIYPLVKILFGSSASVVDLNASVALIRTDGMFQENPDSGDNRSFISAPLTSRGIKGGFVFTFGFKNNQVAGDSLISKTKGATTTWYNQAVRYTDEEGRFSRFGFAIMKDMKFEDEELESYPLITKNKTTFDTYFQNNTYFWCGDYALNKPFENPLVWNKDPMTNANLTYQLNIISYYMGLYVFGIKFFTDNRMVKKLFGKQETKLYLYRNNTRYELFDDIFVKEGYDTSNILIESTNIKYDSVKNQVEFIDVDLTNITSWAIGITNDSGDKELLLACNEPLNGIKFVNRHIRPGVMEIGTTSALEFRFEDDLSMFSSIEEWKFEFPITNLSRNIVISNNFYFEIETPIEVTLKDTLTISGSIENWDFVFPVETLLSDFVISNTMLFEIETPIEFTFKDTLGMSAAIEHWQFIFPRPELLGDINLTDNLLFEIEKPIIVSLKDTLGMSSIINSREIAYINFIMEDVIELNGEIKESYNEFEWRSGGTVPIGGQNCSIIGDVGNVKCDTVCEFVFVNTIFSLSDLTNNPECGQGVEKWVCTGSGKSWSCSLYEGQVSIQNCKTCVHVVDPQ